MESYSGEVMLHCLVVHVRTIHGRVHDAAKEHGTKRKKGEFAGIRYDLDKFSRVQLTIV